MIMTGTATTAFLRASTACLQSRGTQMLTSLPASSKANANTTRARSERSRATDRVPAI